MRSRVVLAAAYTAAQTLLVLVMVGAAIAKIAVDGWLEYFQHFTNWSWTLQALFYAATLPAPLIVALGVDDWRLDLQCAIIALFFVPLWGIVSSVLSLVVVMLVTGAHFLDEFIKVVPISLLVLGNEVFHFVTVLALLVWAVAMQRILYFALNRLFSQPRVHRARRFFWGLVTYQVFLAPAVPVLLYLAIFDPQTVYTTSLSVVAGAFVAAATLLLSDWPLFAFLFFFYMGDAPLNPRWLRESEFEAPADRVAIDYTTAAQARIFWRMK